MKSPVEYAKWLLENKVHRSKAAYEEVLRNTHKLANAATNELVAGCIPSVRSLVKPTQTFWNNVHGYLKNHPPA